MFVVARFPLGGAFTLISPPVARFVGHGQVSVVLGRNALSGIWALAPHPLCLGHGGILRAEGTGGSVGRFFPRSGPVTGIWRDPVLGGSSAMAGSRGPSVLLCRSVGIFIKWEGWVYVAPVRTGCGVNQMCLMPGTAPLVRLFGGCGSVGYGWVRWETVRFGLVRMVRFRFG